MIIYWRLKTPLPSGSKKDPQAGPFHKVTCRYSAEAKLRDTEESTAMPGPMVEETVMDLRYLPFAAEGFMNDFWS